MSLRRSRNDERIVSRLDVVAHRQRAGRRAEPREPTSSSPSTASTPGAMDAHRHRAGRARSTRRWVPAVEISGGSAANTMVGLASFGGTAAFIGRVADDQLGEVFAPRPPRRRRASSTRRPRPTATPTGRCLIIVTPDARAHDEHVPRRVGASSARADVDADSSRARAGRCTSRATSGTSPTAKDAYRLAAAHRARRRQPRRAHAVRLLLRRAPPRRVPRAGRARRRHPVRQRGRDHARSTRSTTSTTRCSSVRAPLRDRRAHPRASRAR